MLKFFSPILFLLLLAPSLWSVSPEAESNDLKALLKRTLAPNLHDLPIMKSKRVIRVLVTYNNTNFFIEEGRERGFEYELLKQYENHLNYRIKNEDQKVHFAFIPVHFNELIPSLLNGTGDIIAAGIKITPDKQEIIDFTTPYLSNIEEILVSSNKAHLPQNLLSLSGKTIYASTDASYWQHLERVNKALTILGKQPITLKSLNPNFETEDYLELVDAGIIDYTLADEHVANIWSKVLSDIRTHADIRFNKGGELAWGVRKNNPLLKEDLSKFAASVKKGTLFGNIFFTRYYEKSRRLENPLARISSLEMKDYHKTFQKYGQMYDYDWLKIAAQALQESNLNPTIESASGAIGLMQLLPNTAYEMGIGNLQDPESNIQGGTHYMHQISNRLEKENQLDSATVFDFSLAAYNAGPTRLAKWRKQAKATGLNPNKWFNNVERIAYQDVGNETVRYVSNINKYYLAYHLATTTAEQKADAIQHAKKPRLERSSESNFESNTHKKTKSAAVIMSQIFE